MMTVSWSKDGRAAGECGRFKVVSDNGSQQLTIPAALSTDSGVYTVTATHPQGGTAAWAVSLHVQEGQAGDEAKVHQLLTQVEVPCRPLTAS